MSSVNITKCLLRPRRTFTVKPPYQYWFTARHFYYKLILSLHCRSISFCVSEMYFHLFVVSYALIIFDFNTLVLMCVGTGNICATEYHVFVWHLLLIPRQLICFRLTVKLSPCSEGSIEPGANFCWVYSVKKLSTDLEASLPQSAEYTSSNLTVCWDHSSVSSSIVD